MDPMYDWTEMREGLRIQIEHIMSKHVHPFLLVVTCEQCGHKITHEHGEPNAIGDFADLMIGQMKSTQILLISEIWGAVLNQQTDTSIMVLMRAWHDFTASLQNNEDERKRKIFITHEHCEGDPVADS